MAQKTSLSPMGLPGRVYSFTAKTPSVNPSSTPSNLGYLTFPIGGGLSKTFLPSGNTVPVVVETQAPSGAPQNGKGVIYQVSGSVVTVHVWDGSQWLARVI